MDPQKWLVRFILFSAMMGGGSAYAANASTGVTVGPCTGSGGFFTANGSMTGCTCTNGRTLSFNPAVTCFSGYAHTCAIAQQNARTGCEGTGGENVCTSRCQAATQSPEPLPPGVWRPGYGLPLPVPARPVTNPTRPRR